jgi:hypothetical protein
MMLAPLEAYFPGERFFRHRLEIRRNGNQHQTLEPVNLIVVVC